MSSHDDTFTKEVLSGIFTGASHGYWFAKNLLSTHVIQPISNILGVSNNANDDSKKGALKVVGVGYGRTGTYSLTLALEQLGHKTLHTQHMYETPAVLDMWDDKIFSPAIASGRAALGEPDFDLVASNGFTATADLPMSLYYEQVYEKYPDCKFILTTRDTPERWFKSWDMLTKTMTQPTRYFRWMDHADKINRYYRWLFARVNSDDSYLSVPLPLPDQSKERAIASYEAHNRRVREIIPSSQLLEFNVKQGWDPLCSFLEVEHCPTTPFPRTNSARSVQVQTVSAMIIPLVVVCFVLFYAFACAFQRYTDQTVAQWSGEKWMKAMRKYSGKLEAKKGSSEMKKKKKKKRA